MQSDRSFLVGESVHLKLSVSVAGQRTPTNPAEVRLQALSLGGVQQTLPEPPDFVRTGDGQYRLELNTTGWSPGVYTWRASASDGPTKTSLVEDRFVLVAPSA